MLKINNQFGEICIPEVCLGKFSDKDDLTRVFPGLTSARFEYPEGSDSYASFLKVYMDLSEFEAYIQEVECVLSDMRDELKGMIDHRDALLGGLIKGFPEMYKRETFVGFYKNLCEAKKDYDLRTMSQGSSTSIDYDKIPEGRCARTEVHIKIAYFAVRAEVEEWIENEGFRIKNKVSSIGEKEKLLEKLKRIRRENHVI